MEKRQTKHLSITGRVQGIGYRAAFQAEARRLRLSGWVRNRHDGSVEASISGTADAVDKMIEWARQGPAGARVHGVQIADSEEAPESGLGFDMWPTR